MNKKTIKAIRSDLNKALAAVGKKYNVAFEVGTIRYDDTSFRATLSALKVDGADPSDKNAVEKAKFEEQASSFGFSSDDYKRKFKVHGTMYEMVGFKPRAKKYPILGRNQNGTTYKFPKSSVTLI